MIVKSVVVTTHILDAHSLKDKRRVIKSIVKRVHQKFNVSISEIGKLDAINYSVLGIVVVTNSDSFADEVLDKCIHLIEFEYSLDIVDIDRDRY